MGRRTEAVGSVAVGRDGRGGGLKQPRRFPLRVIILLEKENSVLGVDLTCGVG